VTNTQLYIVVLLPIVINIVFNGTALLLLKDLFRAELKRVEEVLDARLKSLDEDVREMRNR
jgi:hypothetical protein